MLIEELGLMDETNQIKKYLQENILNTFEAYTKKKFSGTAKILRGFVSSFASFAGLPFVQPAMGAAGDYLILAYLFAVATIIAFGAGAIWISNRIIDEYEINQKNKNILIKTNKNKAIIKEVFVHLMSAVTSSIPVYITYQYNDTSLYLMITIPISYAFNYYGFSKIFFTNLIRNSVIIHEKKVSHHKTALTNHIKFRVLPSVVNMNANELQEFYDSLFSHGSEAQFLSSLVAATVISGHNKVPEYHRPCGIQTRLLFQICNMVFPTVNTALDFHLAYSAAKLVDNGEIFPNIFGVIAATPAFTMNSIATLHGAGRIFDSIFNRIHCNPETLLLPNKHPTLNFVLLAFSTVIALLSSSNKGYVAYTSAYKQMRILITVAAVTSSTIFETRALVDIQHDLFKLYTLYYGNDQEKLITAIQEKLIEFLDVIQNASSSDSQKFFSQYESHMDILLPKNDNRYGSPTWYDENDEEAPLPSKLYPLYELSINKGKPSSTRDAHFAPTEKNTI